MQQLALTNLAGLLYYCECEYAVLRNYQSPWVQRLDDGVAWKSLKSKQEQNLYSDTVLLDSLVPEGAVGNKRIGNRRNVEQSIY